MTSGMLKAHRNIWLILLIAVPVLIFLSVRNLNFSEENISESTSEAIYQNEYIASARVRPTSKGIELVLILNKPLKAAAPIVYALENGKRTYIIGLLGSETEQVFVVRPNLMGIEIVDASKDEVVTKLDF